MAKKRKLKEDKTISMISIFKKTGIDPDCEITYSDATTKVTDITNARKLIDELDFEQSMKEVINGGTLYVYT